jgi:PAS domain-containing protein
MEQSSLQLENKSKEALIDLLIKTQSELKREKERNDSVRCLIDNICQMIVMVDVNHRVVDSNNSFLTSIGQSFVDIKGMPIYECSWWNYEGGLEAYLAITKECLATKKLVQSEALIKAITIDQKPVYIDCSFIPILGRINLGLIGTR